MNASIYFSLNGKSYTFKGVWPEEIDEEIGAAQERLVARDGFPAQANGDVLTICSAIIREAGGRITGTEGTRPDGTIQAEDLSDFVVY